MENKNAPAPENPIITSDYLESIGFEKQTYEFGWTNYRKDNLQLVNIPLKKGGFIVGYEYTLKFQAKYKYPIRLNEFKAIYLFINGKELPNEIKETV